MSGLVVAISIACAFAAGWPRTRPRRVAGPERTARGVRYGRQRSCAIGVALTGLIFVVGPVIVATTAALCGIAWWWRTRLARAQHTTRLRAALPDAIDLIAAVLGAGGSVRQAFAALETRGPPVLRSALARASDHRAAGVAFASWGEAFLAEAGEDYRPLIRALLATERDGAPVATLLERLADESRRARSDEREVVSKRLPLLLLGPLVMCSLPAVLVGSVIPLVLVAVGAVDLG